MRKRTFLALGLVLIAGLAAAAILPARYYKHVLSKAEQVTNGAMACPFVGEYDATGQPTAVLLPTGEGWVRPWDDFRDAVLNNEGAKPFHFGMIVLRDEPDPSGAEIWGWSYRDHAFWRDGAASVFRLANPGNAIADCACASPYGCR